MVRTSGSLPCASSSESCFPSDRGQQVPSREIVRISPEAATTREGVHHRDTEDTEEARIRIASVADLLTFSVLLRASVVN